MDNGYSWIALNNGLPPYVAATTLAINDSGYVFAGIYGNGIYRSTDNGTSWIAVNNGLPEYTNVNTLAINDSGYIFAGLDENGIYRSKDNGRYWFAINRGLPTNVPIRSIATSSSGYVFAGIYIDGGIYRSTDNGDSWYAVNRGLPGNERFYTTTIAINYNGHVFAGIGVGSLYRSTDNGENWTEINNGLPDDHLVLSLTFNSEGHIFAGTGAGNWGISEEGLCQGIYLSTNNGDSWTKISDGLPTDVSIASLAINSAGFVFAGTYINSDMAIEGRGVYRSVGPSVDINQEHNDSPKHYELCHNYPNPFNHTTTIEYIIPQSSKVLLKIFNIYGREVRTLIDEQQMAGVKKVVWDGRDTFGKNVSSGLYIYRIEARNCVKSRKMILMQ
jgi:photosystem II stability/assembly factor-like uncharacterized protein